MYIQNEGGTRKAIEKGVREVRRMRTALLETPRIPMDLSDLIAGAECGGSDFTSGLAGNVTVGRLFDKLVDAGGTAVFEEIVEAAGLRDFLASRAASEEIARDLGVTYDKALAYCRSARQYSVSPGNFAGGLSTIEEKSMGAVVKSGTRPIQGILKAGISPPRSGLWLLDSTPDPYRMRFGITNPNDSEGLMDLISCGCHIVILVTGRGSVVGSAVSPCVKVTGSSAAFKAMTEDMDFDAGPVLEGNVSRDTMGGQLLELIIKTAGGQQTCSGTPGRKEYFIPCKFQEKTTIKKCAGA